jgi:hypothetical protein
MVATRFANDDLLNPGLIDDPFPYYRQLREMVRRFLKMSLAGEIRYQPRILSRSIAAPMLLSVA